MEKKKMASLANNETIAQIIEACSKAKVKSFKGCGLDIEFDLDPHEVDVVEVPVIVPSDSTEEEELKAEAEADDDMLIITDPEAWFDKETTSDKH